MLMSSDEVRPWDQTPEGQTEAVPGPSEAQRLTSLEERVGVKALQLQRRPGGAPGIEGGTLSETLKRAEDQAHVLGALDEEAAKVTSPTEVAPEADAPGAQAAEATAEATAAEAAAEAPAEATVADVAEASAEDEAAVHDAPAVASTLLDAASPAVDATADPPADAAEEPEVADLAAHEAVPATLAEGLEARLSGLEEQVADLAARMGNEVRFSTRILDFQLCNWLLASSGF